MAESSDGAVPVTSGSYDVPATAATFDDVYVVLFRGAASGMWLVQSATTDLEGAMRTADHCAGVVIRTPIIYDGFTRGGHR